MATIIGTLERTVARGKPMFWIKWNKSKCDTVRVPLRALTDIGSPELGTMLKCVVTKLGPELSKIKSAWCAHPMTDRVEISSPEACRRMLSDRRRRAASERAHTQSRFFHTESSDSDSSTDETTKRTNKGCQKAVKDTSLCFSHLAWNPRWTPRKRKTNS